MPSTRIAALTAGGVGIVALGAGSFFGVSALTQRNSAHCAGTLCPDDASAAKLEDAKRAATASTIAFIAGGVLVASGAVLWIASPSATPNVRVGAVAGPGCGRVEIGARF